MIERQTGRHPSHPCYRQPAIHRFSDAQAWQEALARDCLELIQVGWAVGRSVRLCLAGGNTPKPVYRRLAQLLRPGLLPFDLAEVSAPASWTGTALPTPRLELLPGDERFVPANPSQLNQTMLLSCFQPLLQSPGCHWLGWDLSTGPEQACAAMDRELASREAAAAPLFDICFLGLGSDGHVAGLFAPPTVAGQAPAEDVDRQALFTAQAGPSWQGLAPTEPRQRVSLGLAALRSSRHIRFLLRAAGKHRACASLLDGRGDGAGVRLLRSLGPQTESVAAYILD